MIFVTFHFAYWRHNLDPMRDTAHVTIPIYRIRNIPTKFMLDNNMSQWSQGWNFTSTNPNSGLFLEDNGMPVRVGTACHRTGTLFHSRFLSRRSISPPSSFPSSQPPPSSTFWRSFSAPLRSRGFGTGGAHAPHVLFSLAPLMVTPLRWQAAGRLLRVVALGRGWCAFESLSNKNPPAYVRMPFPFQYSISASIMALALGITLGIREQNTVRVLSGGFGDCNF